MWQRGEKCTAVAPSNEGRREGKVWPVYGVCLWKMLHPYCSLGGGFLPSVGFVEDLRVLHSFEVVRKMGFCFPDSCIDHRPI